jgi:hypothetical protein
MAGAVAGSGHSIRIDGERHYRRHAVLAENVTTQTNDAARTSQIRSVEIP